MPPCSTRIGQAFASLGSAVFLQAGELKADIGIVEALRTGTYPVAADIIKAGEPIGQVILIADVSDLRRQLLEVLLTSLAVAVIAAVVSLAIARRLQSRITGPILYADIGDPGNPLHPDLRRHRHSLGRWRDRASGRQLQRHDR